MEEGYRHTHTHQPSHFVTTCPRVVEREGNLNPQPLVSLVPASFLLCEHLTELTRILVFKGTEFSHELAPNASPLLIWCSKKWECVLTLQAKLAVLASRRERI